MKHYRDRIYDSYSSSRETPLAPVSLEDLKPRGHFLSKLIRDHFPKDKHAAILDVGCGYGAVLHFAAKFGYDNLTGVDGSTEQVQGAHSLGISSVQHGSLSTFLDAAEPASYDCIVAFDVIEHFTKAELVGLVDAVRRALRPGGRWIIHIPNGDSPFFGRVLYGDFTHETAFTQTSINQLLRSSGFKTIQCHEDRPIVHGPISAVRYFIWHFIRLLIKGYIAAESGHYSKNDILSQNFLVIAR